MAFYDKFPYTNFQELNLDQIIKTVKELKADWDEWYPTHEFKFADPIEWDGNTFYEIYTVVLGPDGNTYLSKQPVPPGVSILNTDYWQKINDASAQIETVNARIDSVIADLDTVAERYPRRSYYMPEEFGAIVDDSNIDCGPAIQSAIEAAFANDGIVLLSEGTYYMSTPVEITDHPIGLFIIGTGAWGREVNRGSGTRIWYSGTGPAIHFANGLQNSILTDFTIYAASGTCMRLSNDEDTTHIARTTMSALKNMRFCYEQTGVICTNAAYFRIEECDFAALDEQAVNRCGINIASTYTNNEYVYFSNITIDNLNYTAYGGTLANKCLNIERASHVFLSNVDLTDADYGLYLDATNHEINFIYIDTIDMARIRKGVYMKLADHAINSFICGQMVYTAPLDMGADDRVIFAEKTAGGAAYNVRIRVDALTLRTGQSVLDYWVDCSSVLDNYVFAPGFTDINFTNPERPKVNYGVTRQTNMNFTTHGTLGATSAVDFNDIKTAGMYPSAITSSAANGPGFNCLLLVFTSDRYSVQYALSVTSQYSLSSRIYDSSTNTWTAWRRVTGEVS